MTLKHVAVESCTVSHGSSSAITGGAFTIAATPNQKVTVDGKKVYVTPLTGSFSGGSAPGFVSGSVAGNWSIAATATKTKADGVLIMRVDDTGTLTAMGTLSPPPPPPAPPTGPIAGPVEIANAGQDKVRAE